MEAVVNSSKETRDLVKEAYDAILARLLSNDLHPGGRLTVDQLARELRFSQTPIRQALVTLTSEGLVIRRPNSGYRISPLLTKTEFDDLFTVRKLLEPHAAYLAAKKSHQNETLGELEALQSQMIAETSTDNTIPYVTFTQLDSQLHNAIARTSCNQVLLESIERLHSQVHLFRLYHDNAMTQDAIEEHAGIIAAIVAGDAAGAEAAMREHLRMAKRRFQNAFQATQKA